MNINDSAYYVNIFLINSMESRNLQRSAGLGMYRFGADQGVKTMRGVAGLHLVTIERER
jgi:hypothetical protein